MRNPFAILGLTPEILRDLTETQIQGLVKSQYRALQLIHHSDHRPSGETSEKELEITEAYVLLENEERFREYRDVYLAKKAQKQRSDDSEYVQRQLTLNSGLAKQYIQFLRTFAEKPEVLTVFNLSNCRLAMYDTIRYMNAGAPILSGVEVFYYLHLNDGIFSQVKLNQAGESDIKECPNLVLVGTVKENSGEVGLVKQMLLRAQPENRLLLSTRDEVRRKNERHTFVGLPQVKKTYLPLRMHPGMKKYAYANFSQYIGQNEFSEIASRLSPEIEVHSYLFGFDTRSKNFVFLGRIRAIELSTTPAT